MNELIQIKDSLLSLLVYDPSNPLIFSSGLFLFLFAAFALVYGMMRRRMMMRMVYVILFSLYFYYKTSGIYFILIAVSATVDFFIGKALVRVEKGGARRALVVLSVAVNLGMLAYFKYTNFFIEIADSIFGSDFLDFKNIFLPVGISFFVFQSLSYTIDIYRRQLKPLDNWLDYFFYLSFFPQLVAGPIVRAKDFIPQIRHNPLYVSREMFSEGIFLIIAGLFKKAVISDYISTNFVDRIFDNPLLYSGFENLMGVLGYTLQIYCDFSGYSDMAIGIALLLGFRFNKNFDSPYRSATITEFWRRWHISLSTWLKDYLYISLGGNRKGRVRTYFNLIVTMLLGGLWHGAAWRFILWGGFHGVALALHKALMGLFPRLKATGDEMHSPVGRFFSTLLTFILVAFGWIFFRAKDLSTGYEIIAQIFTNFRPDLALEVVSGYWQVFLLMTIGYTLHFLPDGCQNWAQRRVSRMPLMAQACIIALLIWGVMQIKSADIQPFIYFQF